MNKMILKPELVKKIKNYFDLNIYETKVWLALLTKGIASAGEIAEISGVPRSRTYDVLDSLEKQGFAIAKIGKPVKYLPVKPGIIIEKLKNNAKKDAEDKVKMLSKVRDTDEYTELEKLHKTGIIPVKREDISSSLRGKSNISGYVREILQNAKKEVIVCTDAVDINYKFKLFQQTFSRLKNSKVKLNVALSGDKQLINKLSKNFGIKIKQIQLPGKFYIVDRKEVLFYVSKDRDDDIAIWINSEFFANSFSDLFNRAYKN
jgi:HTH-type transcriptional regulator, sugar sensing transcriptional regulator